MSLFDDASPTASPRRTLWPLIRVLACVVAALILLAILRLPKPNRNALALGLAATAERVNIALQPPVELDFKSKAEVLELRQSAARRYPVLLAQEYTPSDAVFGQIVDDVPWWGIPGQFYYGPGGKSIVGPSEESRFILNPYLLVAPDFNDYYQWKEVIQESEIGTAPLVCLPRDLQWWPRAGRAEVTYDARCVKQRRTNSFDLIAYNARDLNLNYIFVSYRDSYQVSRPDPPTKPYANPQFIHKGNSCGYPGGCNNMSPTTPDIEGLEVTGTPARLVTRLWREEPFSPEQKPDMLFVIRFQ